MTVPVTSVQMCDITDSSHLLYQMRQLRSIRRLLSADVMHDLSSGVCPLQAGLLQFSSDCRVQLTFTSNVSSQYRIQPLKWQN